MAQTYGVFATKAIKQREMIFAVPIKLAITAKSLREHKVLKEIFEEAEEIFDPAYNEDADLLVLFTFILYERQRGDLSEWKPFIDMFINELPCFEWDEEVLQAFQDEHLYRRLTRYKRPQWYNLWAHLRDISSKYTPRVFAPSIPEFSHKRLSRDAFVSLY